MTAPTHVPVGIDKRPEPFSPGESFTPFQVQAMRDIIAAPDFEFACGLPPTDDTDDLGRPRKPQPWAFMYYTRAALNVVVIGQRRILRMAAAETSSVRS